MQPRPMGGMMSPQQQSMGFGGGVAGPHPTFGGPGIQPMMGATPAANETLQKKADQAFAGLAVFK